MLQYCIDYQSGCYDHNISICTVTCLLFDDAGPADIPTMRLCVALYHPKWVTRLDFVMHTEVCCFWCTADVTVVVASPG